MPAFQSPIKTPIPPKIDRAFSEESAWAILAVGVAESLFRP